jgi:uncharacterized protein DUF2852
MEHHRSKTMTTFAARLKEVPSPIWIALAVAAFWLCGPLGLAILAVLLCSGMMAGCGMGFGHTHGRIDRDRFAWPSGPRPSGNQAFDDYRSATLRRLEEEQQEFHGFLARLRAAKDQAEFDQFMGERGPPSGPRA